ncbi:MAG: phosphoribosylaminoimidazolesuccinocarboxamide synthase [Phycisphaerae bacterium]|nr:phosphoribosylaminoimidazolesuccinocarboxamide synthase [Phycisphaerae bacterium]
MNTEAQAILKTEVRGLPIKRGKVRDIYDLGDQLVLVASDRISAFDVVMPNGISHKGVLLTQISNFWFERFKDRVRNHLIGTKLTDLPEAFRAQPQVFAGRSVLVRKYPVVPIECVVRGYITGSGWKEYKTSGTVCGIKLPAGLRQCDKLPEPLFTPATKAATGHDENISFETASEIVDQVVLDQLKKTSLDLYQAAAQYAREKGIIIADTKFEFGLAGDGQIVLVDEVLTPDSSRFWPADQYEPGHDQPSFDKQFVRNYLETLDWDKTPPGPQLPAEVVEGTSRRYAEAYERLTGRKFDPLAIAKG